MRALLLLLALVGCGKSDEPVKRAPPPLDAAPVAAPPVATPDAHLAYERMAFATECRWDVDCTLAQEVPAPECCAGCDELRAYDRTARAEMLTARDGCKPCSGHCGTDAFGQRAACVHTTCVVERATCRDDDDCVATSYADDNDCCGSTCGRVQHVFHVDDFAVFERARIAHCVGFSERCSEKDCDDDDHTIAVCRAGRCEPSEGDGVYHLKPAR